MSTATAADIEFVDHSAPAGEPQKIRKVYECRINGTSVLLSKDHPPKIHGVDDWDDAVMVTLTLFASEIRIGAPRD